MSKLQELDNKYVANTYARFPVEIVSGKGSIAKDTDGKDYIDMGSGIGVTSFGIADDIWKQAVIDQLGKVQHMSNLYYTEPCVKLAELLCEKTGMKKVFFSNSGGEANECASKVARKYAAEKKRAGVLHHPHPVEQLPRAYPHHPGRNRAGSLPRTVPAPDSRFCPCHSQRSGERAKTGGSP